MTLRQLLNLMAINIGSETHCFSKIEINSVGIYVNPATGIPLNESQIKQVEYFKYHQSINSYSE